MTKSLFAVVLTCNLGNTTYADHTTHHFLWKNPRCKPVKWATLLHPSTGEAHCGAYNLEFSPDEAIDAFSQSALTLDGPLTSGAVSYLRNYRGAGLCLVEFHDVVTDCGRYLEIAGDALRADLHDPKLHERITVLGEVCVSPPTFELNSQYTLYDVFADALATLKAPYEQGSIKDFPQEVFHPELF